MRIKIKSEKELRELFESDPEYINSYLGWRNNLGNLFNNRMFKYCGQYLTTNEKYKGFYDFETTIDGYSFGWRKEWVDIYPLRMKEIDV